MKILVSIGLALCSVFIIAGWLTTCAILANQVSAEAGLIAFVAPPLFWLWWVMRMWSA